MPICLKRAEDIHSKEYDEAIKDFEESLRRGYKSPIQYVQLGDAYLQVKKTDEAMKNYFEVLSKDPNMTYVMARIVFVYFQKANFELAKE